MMLDHLGERAAHDRIVAAIAHVFAEGEMRTPDLGGTATTAQVGAAIAQAVTEKTRQPA
jgi:tartrate dehydrogenase/decarboxylase/D-malate dehydrogenase